MNPVYIDLHIHTSNNPDALNLNYDIDCLLKKIIENANNSKYLISFTDHNVINKTVYLNAIEKIENIILGVELHVKTYPQEGPYHCHIYFKTEKIIEDIINDINNKLNTLYPKKNITATDEVPLVEDIIREFENYDFLLLPHGGQAHGTFDESVPDDKQFDSTIERSLYYNLFDGFTARSNSGLEKTIKYFERLGIKDFINLVTSTDNYNPLIYPAPKDSQASEFIPTWMFALPTFDGLRVSLSESSRLIYSKTCPNPWPKYISKARLNNDKIDIDVELTSGLNVVIGDSSSGKTLFVDSLYNKAKGVFDNSDYKD